MKRCCWVVGEVGSGVTHAHVNQHLHNQQHCVCVVVCEVCPCKGLCAKVCEGVHISGGLSVASGVRCDLNSLPTFVVHAENFKRLVICCQGTSTERHQASATRRGVLFRKGSWSRRAQQRGSAAARRSQFAIGGCQVVYRGMCQQQQHSPLTKPCSPVLCEDSGVEQQFAL